MKQYFLLIAAISCFSVASAQTGNDAKKNPEPKTMNQLYYVGDSSQLVSMEQGLAAMKTKSKLGGFAGASTSYIIEGPSSPMHINNHYPSFTIKLANMGSMGMSMDPSQIMRLYKFETKDKSRESVISKIGVMGKGSNTNMEGIKYTYKQAGDGVYILVPAEALEPGEYGFVNLTAPKDVSNRRSIKYEAFAFAIQR